MRAMSSDSQGLESTGLALRAGPTLPLHQPSQALAAAVMQIARAAYTPVPSLPPQTPAADRQAKEPSREARGKKGVGDEG